jgi:hypothetical protein
MELSCILDEHDPEDIAQYGEFVLVLFAGRNEYAVTRPERYGLVLHLRFGPRGAVSKNHFL